MHHIIARHHSAKTQEDIPAPRMHTRELRMPGKLDISNHPTQILQSPKPAVNPRQSPLLQTVIDLIAHAEKIIPGVQEEFSSAEVFQLIIVGNGSCPELYITSRPVDNEIWKEQGISRFISIGFPVYGEDNAGRMVLQGRSPEHVIGENGLLIRYTVYQSFEKEFITYPAMSILNRRLWFDPQNKPIIRKNAEWFVKYIDEHKYKDSAEFEGTTYDKLTGE